MEERKELESGFRILSILMIESNFNRIQTVEFNNPEIKQDVNVDVSISLKDNTVAVAQNMEYKQLFNETVQVSATIKMIGVFEKIGESSLDLEQFGKVNGAAIIYPYIREHLSYLSAKAGIGLIFLPPINLTIKTSKNSMQK